MSVRAKFRLNSYETRMFDVWKDGKQVGKKEARTLVFNVVTGDGAPENKAFFQSTPTGDIKLSTVSESAWSQFELNKEYYVDFTPAE